MSAAESIKKARERESAEKQAYENIIIIGIAALFRAALIARDEVPDELNLNNYAIREARGFVSACKSEGLWPEDVRRL